MRFRSAAWVLGLMIVAQAGPASAQTPQQLGQLVTEAGEFEEREQFDQAIDRYERALQAAVKLFGAQHEYAAALNQSLATLHAKLGRYEKAAEHQARTLDVATRLGDVPLAAEAANNLAGYYW
jgi:tetratricopeptide (TPR) repeat protein